MTTAEIVLLALVLVGLLVYAFATNSKAAEVGRLVFFAALLAICFVLARGLRV